jgi:aryl-alcohol dehydrogenase-like predicted oxidoreductase
MNYKLFGNTGLRVSELCLGTMTFGMEWTWGADHETSKKIFETYANAGGNFIDTANLYTNGTSEKFTGEFISSERDHFILATKYTFRDSNGEDRKRDPNTSGNHRKNMMRSVEASLKRLKTDFIDILWMHAWDPFTPVEEVMRALNDLVQSGKVLYIGISDTPAWVVAQANTIAQFRGWNAFAGLQIEYSLVQRSAERDLLPMAKAFGLTVTPWSPLAGGILTGKYLLNENGRHPSTSPRRSEKNMKIAQAVVDIAGKIGCTPAQLSLAFTRRKKLNTIPIIGARTVDQLKDSLGVLQLDPSDEIFNELEFASKIELGFPHDMLNSKNVKELVYSEEFDKIIDK